MCFTSLDMVVFFIISVLGSDGGTRTMINRCKQCSQVAIENTPNILSASEDRAFYISWEGKTFSGNLRQDICEHVWSSGKVHDYKSLDREFEPCCHQHLCVLGQHT